MGSLFHLLDINEDIMARKVAHKRHVGGLEAPRNSLELQMETSYGLYSARDNILYSHHMAKESSGKDYYFTEAPIKKLISEEISKKSNTRQNAPSVVARLMGVDMLPLDSKPAPKVVNVKNQNPTGKLMMDNKPSKKSSVGHVYSASELEVGSFGQRHYVDRYADQYNSHVKSNKPKPREHPQEEELQKFKKEFEAWQAARFKECADFMKVPAQLIAQEDLNRQKMYRYTNSQKTTNIERFIKTIDNAEMVDPHDMPTSGSCIKENKESRYSNRMSRTDCRFSQLDIVSGPTKIVILRPGPDRMDINEDSWNSTPSTSEDRGGIQDFLEEVKERLKSELQGKCLKRSTTIRGGGIETPYREKPSESQKIARSIAQEVRDSVSRDINMNLLRSESTRSYRNEFQLNGTESPEFINRDTRRFLAERLRNVLKGETNLEAPRAVRYNRSRLSMSDEKDELDGQSGDTWIDNKMSCYTNEIEKQSRSFRREPTHEGLVNHKDMSPRNLIRSLSAPVSGTSFGKLLLEDRHVLTGAHIRRKHEVIEKVSLNIKKQRKDKFNIREKVSSFRYSLTLRGRLFRRRVKSVDGSDQNKNNLLRDIRSGPTVMMSFSETNENSTEVPPSPASVCSSSVQEELWRQADYLSPISSSSGLQLEDSDMSHVFREINSNLNELRRKLDQLDGADPEETIKEVQPTEVELDIQDQTEAYIRDLLIASGLYDGSFSQSMSKWDPLGKPISTHVFEEVEETYKESTKDGETEGCRKDEGGKLNHKMLLDLLNEVLPAILREPTNMSINTGNAIGRVHKPLYGRKLLSRVWNNIRVYVHPPEDRSYYSLDNMLARDLKSSIWSRMMDDDVNALGRDIESQITGDLIFEVVREMCS